MGLSECHSSSTQVLSLLSQAEGPKAVWRIVQAFPAASESSQGLITPQGVFTRRTRSGQACSSSLQHSEMLCLQLSGHRTRLVKPLLILPFDATLSAAFESMRTLSFQSRDYSVWQAVSMHSCSRD